MKNAVINEEASTFCEFCDPLFGRGSAHKNYSMECNSIAALDITSEYVFCTTGGNFDLRMKCTRPRGHTGNHVACCKLEGTLVGVWKRFHIMWED